MFYTVDNWIVGDASRWSFITCSMALAMGHNIFPKGLLWMAITRNTEKMG